MRNHFLPATATILTSTKMPLPTLVLLCLPDTAVVGTRRSHSPWLSMESSLSPRPCYCLQWSTLVSRTILRPLTQESAVAHRIQTSWKSSVSFPVSEKLTVSLLCRVVLLLHNLHCAPSQRPFTFPTTLGVRLSPDAWKLVILTAKPNLFK